MAVQAQGQAGTPALLPARLGLIRAWGCLLPSDTWRLGPDLKATAFTAPHGGSVLRETRLLEQASSDDGDQGPLDPGEGALLDAGRIERGRGNEDEQRVEGGMRDGVERAARPLQEDVHAHP